MELKKLYEFIDDSSRILVGTLLKRIEVLEKENALNPNIYKAITKELIYENARNLKKLIEVYTTVGKIVFKPKDSSEKKQ